MHAMSQTPSSNNNDNSAPGAAVHAAHPQPHIVKLMNIRSLTFSSSQESIGGDDFLRKGRKRKTTTQAIQISPNGQHEIENTHLTELPSPDYACQYAKDRLTGKITCMVCGEEGHYTCDCSMKDQEEKVICTLCNRVGHCHLWCCRQNVSENRACHRCGEKGHYTKKKKLSCCGQKCGHNKDISCSSCDTNHLLGKCPMGDITCYICEGKDHVPAHCRLSPMITAVTQYHRESFHATLKMAMTETSRRTLAPVKPSGEFPHDEEVPKVSNLSSSGHGHSERKNTIRSEVPDSDKTSHATMTDKALALESESTCFNCHEEGQCANRCPRKKPSGELGLHDVNYRKKKLSRELELCDITCFKCHDKGHKSYSCPKQSHGELELSDVTCYKCHDKGHKSYSCPKKKSPGELELSDVTSFKCHDKGHRSYSCSKKKSPGELELSDVTCFKCHDRGHRSDSCSKKKSPAELELSDVTCFKCHDKGHKSYMCPKKKSPGKLEPI